MVPLNGKPVLTIPHKRSPHSKEWALMQKRYKRLGKAEHFRTIRTCAADLKEVDWYAKAATAKKERDLRELKLRRLAALHRAQRAYEEALADAN